MDNAPDKSPDTKTLNELCRDYKDTTNADAHNEIIRKMYDTGQVLAARKLFRLSQIPYEPDALDIALRETILSIKLRLDADIGGVATTKPIISEEFEGFFLNSVRNDLLEIHKRQKFRSRFYGGDYVNYANGLSVYPAEVAYDDPFTKASELREYLKTALRKWLVSRMNDSTYNRMQEYCDSIKTFLYSIKDMPTKDIAERLHCKPAAAKQRIIRGRELMRRFAPDFPMLLENAPNPEKAAFINNLDVEAIMLEVLDADKDQIAKIVARHGNKTPSMARA